MKKTHITIIIVTFNSEKYISNCVETIIETTRSEYDLEIILIDNNSIDNTTKTIGLVEKKYPFVTAVYNKTNIGFAKAVNDGLKRNNTSQYFILLNPDTFVEKNSLVNLIKCAVKSQSGIVGGSTFDANKNENGSYFRFPNIWIGLFDFTNLRKIIRSDYWHRYFYYLDNRIQNGPCFYVDVVTGGFMLITRDTIKKIGYFDERFFMYLEDVDYCLRAEKAGIKITHTNKSVIFHHGGGSSNNKDRIHHSAWLLSRKKYFMKNFGLLTNMLIQPVFLLDDLFILLNKYIKR